MREAVWSFMARHRRSVTVGSFAVAFVLGVVGWLTTTPEMDFWTAAYRSMRLFVLDGPDTGDISLWLALARFLAPLATFLGFVVLAFAVMGDTWARRLAKRQRGHTVVLGGAPEAVEIARRAHGHPESKGVVIIGEISASDSKDLRRQGVIHLAEAETESRLFEKVVKRAKRVVIAGTDDKQAMSLTRRVGRHRDDSEGTVITLLADRELAGDWPHSSATAALCRSAHVATVVVREEPPYAEDAVTPAPIVIGDGPLATELARRIIEGWQRPGERLTIHCAGPDETWVQMARLGLESVTRVEWHQMRASGHVAPRVVREALDQWRQHRLDLYHEAQARVYVSFEDDTVTLPIANAIGRALAKDVRVIAVVDDPDSVLREQPEVRVIGRQELLCDPNQLWRTMADDLADEIVADLGRWPAEVPSVFGPIRRAPDQAPDRAAILSAQDSPVQEAIRSVADAAEAILEQAGFVLHTAQPGRAEAQVLDPAELKAIADRLDELVPKTLAGVSEAERRTRLFELASALPTTFRRLGYSVVRVDGRPDLLSADDIMLLAMSAHQGYLDVAEETGNASGSAFAEATWEQLTEYERRSNVAQVLDIPVKLATVGLGWQKVSREAAPVGTFTSAEIELLAEQEHRRWAHFEIRNSRHDHEWNKSWAAIKDYPVADYDREACRRIPAYLAHVGLVIVPRASQPPVDEVVAPAGRAEAAPESDVRRFRRRGRAWAWRLDEPCDWQSPRGDTLQAQAGDWWVVGEDGVSRTVAPDSFAETYERVAAQEYLRIGVVTARQVTERESVSTREGDATVEPGDWVVMDAQGARWSVPGEEFAMLYETVLDEGEL